jgi:RNA polymerase sigma factor (sigma-70 family)
MNADSAQFATSNDLDLVHASKQGDVAVFEQLVKPYDRRLLRISQTVTRNREDSEDAVREALLKAFQNLAEFREDSQLSTWLIRITVNQSLMKLRKQRTQKEVSLDEDFQTEGGGSLWTFPIAPRCSARLVHPETAFQQTSSDPFADSLTAALPTTVHEDTWMVRLDHKFSEKTLLHGSEDSIGGEICWPRKSEPAPTRSPRVIVLISLESVQQE